MVKLQEYKYFWSSLVHRSFHGLPVTTDLVKLQGSKWFWSSLIHGKFHGFTIIGMVKYKNINGFGPALYTWKFPWIYIYIYIVQHSAKSLFDLWLFLLRWPHTPLAFLGTSLPTRPLLLEKRTATTVLWNSVWVL